MPVNDYCVAAQFPIPNSQYLIPLQHVIMLHKDASTLQDFSSATTCEWLETNGLGGWSSSSIIGCNTRRYHGLLVAATVPPAERMSLVAKLDETIICGPERFELGSNNYGDAVHPAGYQYMTGFGKDLFPQFMYKAGGIELKKTIAMVQGENTVVIIYDIEKSPGAFIMELQPLISVRNYHSLMRANNTINRSASFDGNVFTVKAYEGKPEVFIKVPGAGYQADPNWFYNFNYSAEQERGLDFTEDLFSHGRFTVELKEGDSIGIILSADDPVNKDAHELMLQEEKRKRTLLQKQPADETMQQLVLAADQFIVKRDIIFPEAWKVSPPDGGGNAEGAGATIIAGYHWFTVWSRDAMISLPGLTLSTGRYEDAKKILVAFANSVSMGMLPNRFRDDGSIPEYNTADGTLWYFIAVYKYLQSSGDKNFVLRDLLPVLKNIMDWHYKGTRYHIHVAGDGLLHGGAEGQQLTWMDAKVEDWVVTPRMGKPVEIQALWYNALNIFAALLQLNNQQEDATIVSANAEKARQSFDNVFWCAEGNYLYDTIDEKGVPNKQVRPNQLFAISLPFALIEGEQAKSVLQVVREQLYTPAGLKSLSAKDPQYIPVYAGDRYKRDAAYHQGTVWSWLLGPYVDALMKVKGEGGKAEGRQVIENFKYHLNQACIGSVSEIFDAEAPHHPKGCIAQAWGVAEVLRVTKEYGLNDSY